jgi:hypothetical protein
MSEYYKYVKAIGTWYANSPLWPGINACHLHRPEIRAQSSHLTKDSLLANEEESIYGHLKTQLRNLEDKYMGISMSRLMCRHFC